MNLSETQLTVRRTLVFLILAIIVYYSGKFIVNTALRFCERAQIPICYTPPIDPEAKYGPLPRLKMKTITINEGVEYILDTQDGSLPAFKDRGNVYRITSPEANLLAEKQMKELAETLGFGPDFTKVSASEFKWVDGVNSRTLNSNVVSEAFNLDTKVDKLTAELLNTPSITEEDATNSVLNFIKSEQLMSVTDIANIRTETIPSIMKFGRIKKAIVSSDTPKLIKVNVYRDLEQTNPDGTKIKYPIMGPKPTDSLISFYTTNSSNIAFTYPLIKFDYWDTDYADFSDYYLSPISNVWSAITQGGGIIAHIKSDKSDYYDTSIPADVEKIEIRDISLAYYETEEFQDYLQPIYVFKGVFKTKAIPNSLPDQGEVIIYYPAVRGDFVQ